MKITIEKKETIEVEVKFPAFFKYGGSCHKVIDENTWIDVEMDMLGETCLKVYSKKPAWADRVLTDGEPIAEEEFNQRFIEVFNRITIHRQQLQEKTQKTDADLLV